MASNRREVAAVTDDNTASFRCQAIELAEAWEQVMASEAPDENLKMHFDALSSALCDRLGLQGTERVRLYSDGWDSDDVMLSLFSVLEHTGRLIRSQHNLTTVLPPDEYRPPVRFSLHKLHLPTLARLVSGEVGPKYRSTRAVRDMLLRAGLTSVPRAADGVSSFCYAEGVLAKCWDEPGAVRRVILGLVSPEEYDSPSDTAVVAGFLNHLLVIKRFAVVPFCGMYGLFGISLTVDSSPGEASLSDLSSVADQHERDGAGEPE